MKQFTRRVRRNGRTSFYFQILIASIGLFLSVALHELVHVVAHWGHVTSVELLPDQHALVSITSATPHGYNPQLEEAIAYSVTMLILLVTIAVICTMKDKRDTRTVLQTVFPKNKFMQSMTPKELFELASRVNLL